MILRIALLAVVAVSGPSLAWAQASASPPAPMASDTNSAQTLAGKGWSTSTGVVTIAANRVLDVVLANAAGSGCSGLITLRKFSNYSTAQLGFVIYNNPGALTGATTLNVGTRQSGTGPQTGLSLSYVTQAAGLMTGTAGVQDGLLATTKEAIDTPYAIPQGKSFGVEITGLTGALSGAVVVSITLVGYCQ